MIFIFTLVFNIMYSRLCKTFSFSASYEEGQDLPKPGNTLQSLEDLVKNVTRKLSSNFICAAKHLPVFSHFPVPNSLFSPLLLNSDTQKMTEKTCFTT